jgi:hypothetical protein
MGTYTKIPFSSSTNGKGIQLSTAGNVTELHRTTTDDAKTDEIWLWMDNYGSSDLKVTVYFGDQETVDSIEKTISSESGLVLVIPGLILVHDDPVEIMHAFGPNTSTTLIAYGYVNRIT